jgi:hypothetical protein
LKVRAEGTATEAVAGIVIPREGVESNARFRFQKRGATPRDPERGS